MISDHIIPLSEEKNFNWLTHTQTVMDTCYNRIFNLFIQLMWCETKSTFGYLLHCIVPPSEGVSVKFDHLSIVVSVCVVRVVNRQKVNACYNIHWRTLTLSTQWISPCTQAACLTIVPCTHLLPFSAADAITLFTSVCYSPDAARVSS